MTELSNAVGGDFATTVLSVKNNFFIATSDKGIYMLVATASTAHCQNFTRLSSNQKRCDICEPSYTLVTVNVADNRVCCRRIEQCKKYNTSNCLC